MLLKQWEEKTLAKALSEAGIKPVMEGLPPEILATHFKKEGREIYFLANPNDKVVSFTPNRKLTPLFGSNDGKASGQGALSLQPWSVTVWEVVS